MPAPDKVPLTFYVYEHPKVPLTFDVYEHPTKGYEAVKRDFSWPGFFFTIFWAFVKRLWLHGIIGLSLLVIIVIVPGLAELEQRSLGNSGLNLILGLVFGFMGNEWRRKRLEAHGWHRLPTVEALDPPAAIAEAKRRAGVETEDDARAILSGAIQLESRGEVAAAIAKYEEIIRGFGGTDAARDAEASIRSLKAKIDGA